MSFLCNSRFTLVISFSLVFSTSQHILHKDVNRIYYIINREVAVSISFITFEINQMIHIMLTRLYYINIKICKRLYFFPILGF